MVAFTTVKDNSIQVSKELQKVSNRIPKLIKKALASAAAFEIGAIKKRTQSKGVDFRGNPFQPYSPKYKRRLVKQSGVVDLTDTGQMFSSLTSRISASKGELFFRQGSANKKAFFHDEAGVGKKKVKREFFSIAKDEETKIEKIFFSMIKKELKL